ncbi:unnamed protein product, partial [marine sediment metagenome]
GSFDAAMYGLQYYTALNYVVPTGHQLKILFLRVWTQEAAPGARFEIVQTNPTSLLPSNTGLAGQVEAFPVVGSVPDGVRDYPMLEAPGAEVLRGSLVDPVHVLEGSIDFNVLAQAPGADDADEAGDATGARYGIVWWGVIKIPEPTR